MTTLDDLQLLITLPEKGKKSVKLDEGRVTWRGNSGGCRVGTVMFQFDAIETTVYIPRLYGGRKMLKMLMELVNQPSCTLYDVCFTQIDDLFVKFDQMEASNAEKYMPTGQMGTIHGLTLQRFHLPNMSHIAIGPQPEDRRWGTGGRRVIIR
jgi:hypothetical protein